MSREVTVASGNEVRGRRSEVRGPRETGRAVGVRRQSTTGDYSRREASGGGAVRERARQASIVPVFCGANGGRTLRRRVGVTSAVTLGAERAVAFHGFVRPFS